MNMALETKKREFEHNRDRDNLATELNILLKKISPIDTDLRLRFHSIVDSYRDGKLKNIDKLARDLIESVFPPKGKDKAERDTERLLANRALRAFRLDREDALDRLSPNVAALIVLLGGLEKLTMKRVKEV